MALRVAPLWIVHQGDGLLAASLAPARMVEMARTFAVPYGVYSRAIVRTRRGEGAHA